MENIKLYCLIYELKGMIKTMSELAEYDDNYQIPMIENVEEKMKEIMQQIEEKSA
jgi:ketol-acid reductoisomerase